MCGHTGWRVGTPARAMQRRCARGDGVLYMHENPECRRLPFTEDWLNGPDARAMCAAGGMGSRSKPSRASSRVPGRVRGECPERVAGRVAAAATAKTVDGAKKHLGFDAKPSLESTAHIFES